MNNSQNAQPRPEHVAPEEPAASVLDPAGLFEAEALERLYREAYAQRLSEEIGRVAQGASDSLPEGSLPSRPQHDALRDLDPAGILSPSAIAVLYREAYLRGVAMEVDRMSGTSTPPSASVTARTARQEAGGARKPSGRGETLFDSDPGAPSADRTMTSCGAPPPSGQSLLVTDLSWKEEIPDSPEQGDLSPSSPAQRAGENASTPRQAFAAWCAQDHPWSRSEELARMLGDLICHVRSLGIYAAYGEGDAPIPQPIEILFRSVLRAVELGLHYNRSMEEISFLTREVLLFSEGTLLGEEDSLRPLIADFERFPEVPQMLRSLPSPKRRGSAKPGEVDRAFGEKAPEMAKLLLRFAALTVLRPEFENPYHALGVLVQVTATGDWDPLPMRVLLGATGLLPVGSRVLLSDGSEAVVVANNAADPLAPRVWLRGDRHGMIDLAAEPELKLKSAVLPAA